MKRFIFSLLISIAGFFTAFGMSFSEAQEHAYYLTDKMAYELDLTPEQYDQVYQVNLEYLLNVRSSNPFNYYWDYRNTDLSYILFDWQYSLYRAADYFYRPVVRRHFSWYFPLWDRYHRTYYYYSRPTIYHTWHGGLWHNRTHHTTSPFYGHRPLTHVGGMAGHGGHFTGPDHHGGARPGGNHNGNHNGGARPGGNYNGNHNGNHHGGARPGGNYNGNHNGGAHPGGNHNGNHNDGARPGGNNNGNHNGGARPGGSNGGSYNNGSSSRPGNGGSQATTGQGSRGGSYSGGSRGGNSSATRGGSTSSPSRGGSYNGSRSSSTPGGSRSSATPGGSRSSVGNSSAGSRSFGGGGRR